MYSLRQEIYLHARKLMEIAMKINTKTLLLSALVICLYTQTQLFAAAKSPSPRTDAELRYAKITLQTALATDDKVIIAQLIAEAGFHGRTLLHDAVDCGDEDLVCTLIAAGAKVNAQNKNGETALHFISARSPHTPPSKDQLRIRIATMLVAAGAQLGTTGNDGYTPLMVAKSWGDNEPMIEFLTHAIARARKID